MMAQLVLWLAIGFACALGACVIAGLLCKTGEKLRMIRRAGWACVLAAVVAVMHGGTKNIKNRVTADTGLTVVSAEMTVPTNDVDNAYLVLKWLGPDENQPLRVRDSVGEPWSYMGSEWLFDDRYYDGGTNTATWWVYAPASNIVPRAHYHIGNDLPPVEIEGDGISILDFSDSSTNVVITYTVERAVLGDNAGVVRVEMQEANGAAWTEIRSDSVYGGSTNTVVIHGFWIGRDTRWRVRVEVDE